MCQDSTYTAIRSVNVASIHDLIQKWNSIALIRLTKSRAMRNLQRFEALYSFHNEFSLTPSLLGARTSLSFLARISTSKVLPPSCILATLAHRELAVSHTIPTLIGIQAGHSTVTCQSHGYHMLSSSPLLILLTMTSEESVSDVHRL